MKIIIFPREQANCFPEFECQVAVHTCHILQLSTNSSNIYILRESTCTYPKNLTISQNRYKQVKIGTTEVRGKNTNIYAYILL